MNKISTAILAALLFLSHSCATTSKREYSSRTNLAIDDLALRGELSALGPFVGTWQGRGRYFLPQDLKTPESPVEISIKSVLRGAGLLVCEKAGDSCNRLDLIHLGTDQSALKVASYSVTAQGGERSVINGSEVVSLTDNGFSWSTIEVGKSQIKNDIIVKSAVNRRYCHLFKKLDSSHLIYVIESSDDAGPWVKFYEAKFRLKTEKQI